MLIVTIYFFWFNCFCSALVIYDLFYFKSTVSESLIRPYLKHTLFFFLNSGLKIRCCNVLETKATLFILLLFHSHVVSIRH